MTTANQSIDAAGGPTVPLEPAGTDGKRAEVELRSPDGVARTLAVSSPALTGVTVAPGSEPGVTDLQITMTSLVEPVRLHCSWPPGLGVSLWRPDGSAHPDLPSDWGTGMAVRSMHAAPVASLVGPDDRAVLTVALSTAVRSCDFGLAVNEESAEAFLRVVVKGVEPTGGALRFGCRIDLRGLHFATALREVTDSWRAELADRVAAVPELARHAMYSTWYSDHQDVTAAKVEQHARVSATYGCRAIIVDDGWQTDDNGRGYAYCGDWEPTPQFFPDMAAHVARVQDMGLAYVLWIAPALIGPRSRVWAALQDKKLAFHEGLGAASLDPRFPDVRRHVVECCRRPLRDWGVDGLKIDFVDTWSIGDRPWAEGMDCQTVDEAVELVLAEIAAVSRELRGQLLIEFRQNYVSPRLWPFGTFLRASDCPLDAVENRVRTIDCRLLAGNRAVHSDMLLWHPTARMEEVAAQFIAVLFATPQISVAPESLTPAHQQVMRHWLDFMSAHADTLQHGELLPSRHDARYAQVVASSDTTTIAVAYTNPVIELPAQPNSQIILVNGTGRPGLIVDLTAAGRVELVVSDCAGSEVSRSVSTLPRGMHRLPVPIGGTAIMTPVNYG